MKFKVLPLLLIYAPTSYSIHVNITVVQIVNELTIKSIVVMYRINRVRKYLRPEPNSFQENYQEKHTVLVVPVTYLDRSIPWSCYMIIVYAGYFHISLIK